MRFVIPIATFCMTAAALAFACGGDDTVTPSPTSSSDGGGDAASDTSLSDSSLPSDSGVDAAHPPARNWAEFPAIAQIDGVSEIWALSDIHGDYAALTKLLNGANVIASVPATPSAVVWNQGTAVLVVVGDLIDKGPDAPDVVRLMMALQISAAAAGGKVIVTMGNHEAEFFADPENDKATKTGTDEGIDPELAAIGLTPDATAAGDDDIGLFLRDLPIAARVDDWFFVHAGKTDGLTATALASAIQTGVDTSGFGADVLAADASILEARLSSSPPQWWDVTNDAGGLLTEWTAAVGAKHLVMGHQPGAVGISAGPNRNNDDMFAAYGGLIFMIDTGMSVGVDNTGGALLHVKNAGTVTVTWEEVLPNGNKKSL
jgi:hypothetical protein